MDNNNNDLLSTALSSFITSFGLTILENELDKSYQKKYEAIKRQHDQFYEELEIRRSFKHRYRDYYNLGRGLSLAQLQYIDSIENDCEANHLLRTMKRN